MSAPLLWVETGGDGARTLVLLHGLGATGAVWRGVLDLLAKRGGVRWVVPDLPGHGASAWCDDYAVPALAQVLGRGLRDCSPCLVLGHSLGAYLGIALAGPGCSVAVRGVLGIGPKISWSGTELAASRELAGRAVRWYPDSAEAQARYGRVSGLGAIPGLDARALARGVSAGERGWRLAQDPRSFSAAGTPFASLVAACRAPLILARGEHDAMVSLAALQSHATAAHELAGCGHNAHVEDPAAVLRLLDPWLAA